jgi:hypothetical protein
MWDSILWDPYVTHFDWRYWVSYSFLYHCECRKRSQHSFELALIWHHLEMVLDRMILLMIDQQLERDPKQLRDFLEGAWW